MQRKILVTGTNPEKYEKLGDVVHQPMIDLKPVEFQKKNLSDYDWVIFTSGFGVKFFLKGHDGFEKNRESFQICAIGKSTSKALEEHGVSADLVPEEYSSKSIVDAFKKIDLKRKSMLIPRSSLSSDYLPDELKKMGAIVDAVTVYENVMPGITKIDLSDIDEIVFTSPSTVRNFYSVYGGVPAGAKVNCIGDVTEDEFSRHKA
jgi:uroporphyrinogen III methyltransferase/synthase